MRIKEEREKILIVDDEKFNVDVLVDLLKPHYRTVVARNGEQALRSLEKSALPSLILLDIMMPGMDGYEVCLRLKENELTREIPVIFMSALAGTFDKVKAFSIGGVDYITKPFLAGEILVRIKNHLKIRRLFQENIKMERHRSIAEMVAGISHELNTPLGVVNTAVNLIGNRLASSEISDLFTQDSDLREVLDDIQSSVYLAQKNIGRAYKLMQNFKKISVNQLTDTRETVDLVELVRDIVRLSGISAKRAGIRIDVRESLSRDDGSWTGYPGHLTQVLLNLLSNIEYHAYSKETGGRVEIDIAADNGREIPTYIITVRDFGHGISHEHLPRIFECFFTTRRNRGGCGLGLSIVHTMVTEGLHGTIDVKSSLGKGTTVTVTFPQSIEEEDGKTSQ